MKWQPMETAPKDGRRIIICASYDNGNREVIVARFEEPDPDKVCDTDRNRWWVPDNADGYYVDAEIGTHWMPLPELPKDESEATP